MFHQALDSTLCRSIPATDAPSICCFHQKAARLSGPQDDLSIHATYNYVVQPTITLLMYAFASPIPTSCGDEGIRTPGLLRARKALSQLSYIPSFTMGHNGLEPLTFPLSEECSNLLS